MVRYSGTPQMQLDTARYYGYSLGYNEIQPDTVDLVQNGSI